MMEIEIKLFVTSNNALVEKWVAKLRQAIEQAPGVKVSIEVFDVIERPDEALANEIYATPTLLRVLPKPILKIIAKLDSLDDVVVAMRHEVYSLE